MIREVLHNKIQSQKRIISQSKGYIKLDLDITTTFLGLLGDYDNKIPKFNWGDRIRLTAELIRKNRRSRINLELPKKRYNLI